MATVYSNRTIEILLEKFKGAIGEDYEKYRNHVYRVFLNCLLLDAGKNNEEKYATAAVFHDIGIWSNHTIDYLDPSIAQMKIHLQQTDKREWIEEIAAMIYWHHKTSSYHGSFEHTVEVFRKADWIDVSLGLISYGVDRKKLLANRNMLANKGFHFFLVKKIFRNLFVHPLRPLPMFKR